MLKTKLKSMMTTWLPKHHIMNKKRAQMEALSPECCSYPVSSKYEFSKLRPTLQTQTSTFSSNVRKKQTETLNILASFPHQQVDNMGRTIKLVSTRKWSERTCKLCPLLERSFCAKSVRQTAEQSNLISALVSITLIRFIWNLERVS